MISVLGRSASLASSLKATSTAIAATSNILATPVILEKEISTPNKTTLDTLNIKNGNLRISSGIGVGLQIRCAHTDFQDPDFDSVRRTATLDPTSNPRNSADSRRLFTYLIGAVSLTTGSYAAKSMVQEAVSTLSASADVLALAQIEINLAKIPEGKSMTFKWRGKPVFVRHRTESDIATERAVDISTLRDPQTDDERVIDPKFMVVVGVCTHLGCVPIADAGDFGGYYCPCHGSHYDGSGRIRKGPAPLNLEVPKHSFPEPGVLIVG